MLFGLGSPPLMLTAVEFFPAALPEAEPPRLSVAPPAPPLVATVEAGWPPGAPPCLPSGEIARRATRFPRGGAAGATGPGVPESAMKVELAAFEEDGARSGAAPG